MKYFADSKRLIPLFLFFIFCSFNSFALDLGFNNPTLPKLIATTLPITYTNITYNNTNITNNYYNITGGNVTGYGSAGKCATWTNETEINWSECGAGSESYFGNVTGSGSTGQICTWFNESQINYTDDFYLASEINTLFDNNTIIRTWNLTNYPNNITASYLNSSSGFLCNGITCYNITELNITSAGGGAQTPWASSIDAAEYDLNNLGNIEHDKASASDFTIANADQDKDILFTINDAATTRTAIQVNGDEGSVTMPRQSYVAVSLTNDQVITTATDTTISWGTENTDVLGEFASNTFTAKDNGIYFASAFVTWDSLSSSQASYVNIVTSAGTFQSYVNAARGVVRENQQATCTVKLTAGQTIIFQVYHTSGSNRAIKGSWGRASIAKVA